MKMATKCLQTVPFAHAIQLWQLVASDAKEAQLASQCLGVRRLVPAFGTPAA
jgi:hypothetical protein